MTAEVTTLFGYKTDKPETLLDAQRLWERVVEKRSLTLGSTHDLTVQAKSRLALLLSTKGESLNAEAMHRECIAALELSRGAAHPLTIAAVQQLTETLEQRIVDIKMQPRLEAQRAPRSPSTKLLKT